MKKIEVDPEDMGTDLPGADQAMLGSQTKSHGKSP
jgi:hypothetical protein